MNHHNHAFINGQWVEVTGHANRPIINPGTREIVGTLALGAKADADRAVEAAHRAFDTYGQSSRQDRLALFERIIAVYERRLDDLGHAVCAEMGAPLQLAVHAHSASGLAHFKVARDILRDYAFEHQVNKSLIRREPIGVCALITPWNWPLNQIACKVAPALAAGCTVVLKPSELAPLSAILFTEVLEEAGVPPGVFNLVQGDGPTVGTALSSHPLVDMVSFTGSTRGGIAVAKAAADTVKRVTQELGGKSANIILAQKDFEKAVRAGAIACFVNSGQTCKAPTRMLVHSSRYNEAVELARDTALSYQMGNPLSSTTQMGPMANLMQYDRVREMIAIGQAEGAQLVCGGVNSTPLSEQGYFISPTVFAGVHNQMRIAREEIFGPVLCIIPFDTEEEAVAIANDTPYGLSGAVWSDSLEHSIEVARKLRTGNVHLNGAPSDIHAPFGGYKQSGNGREWGVLGFEDFLETKAMIGLPLQS